MHLKMVVPADPCTRGLEDGRVSMPDLTWECVSSIGNAPERFVATEQADVGENGVRRMVMDHLEGAAPRALPVFFGREHMQRNLYVVKDSPLTHPRDLAGKRVGSRLEARSGTCAGVLMMLDRAYGIPLQEVEWRLGRADLLPNNRMGLRFRNGEPTNQGNFDQLRRGELDAVIVTGGPRYWSLFGPEKLDVDRDDDIRPLVSDPQGIADVYRASRLCPITDVVVVRPGLADDQPGLAAKLVDVFSRANELAPEYRSADEQRMAEEEVRLLGEDPHRYGLGEDERRNLAEYIDFLYRMGAIERYVEPEAIFIR